MRDRKSWIEGLPPEPRGRRAKETRRRLPKAQIIILQHFWKDIISFHKKGNRLASDDSTP